MHKNTVKENVFLPAYLTLKKKHIEFKVFRSKCNTQKNGVVEMTNIRSSRWCWLFSNTKIISRYANFHSLQCYRIWHVSLSNIGIKVTSYAMPLILYIFLLCLFLDFWIKFNQNKIFGHKSNSTKLHKTEG